jgi:WD40 repeat protein
MLVAHQDAKPGSAYLVDIHGGDGALKDLWPRDRSVVGPVVFRADGRFAAMSTFMALEDQAVISVWDLEASKETLLALRDNVITSQQDSYLRGVVNLCFQPDGSLLSAGFAGVRRWDFESGTGEWLFRVPEETLMSMACSSDGRFLLTTEKPSLTSLEGSNLRLHDLEGGSSTEITTHGQSVFRFLVDETRPIIVTGGVDGVVRVGPLDGGEPHLLYGHEGGISALEVSPDGRWIGSGDENGTIRLWPTPDLSKPPLHILPHDELIAKLKTLTNLRAVRDEESPTGWKIEVGPFPGWAEVQEW